ncbi:MAG: phosphoribosyl-AMP cyclohydrolase [Armatimonadetes bacterium]|nr:phosphoribosyl-AMP cyclohydrolase [Armatimonadota bacterium]
MLNEFLNSLKYDKDGLIPAVVQDDSNGDVLMVAYMNRDAVVQTLTSGRACFWSRSRQKFWIKGETSGNIQAVKSVYIDCDKDCLVVKVDQTGAACHEGYRSCFFRKVDSDGRETVVSERLSEAY